MLRNRVKNGAEIIKRCKERQEFLEKQVELLQNKLRGNYKAPEIMEIEDNEGEEQEYKETKEQNIESDQEEEDQEIEQKYENPILPSSSSQIGQKEEPLKELKFFVATTLNELHRSYQASRDYKQFLNRDYQELGRFLNNLMRIFYRDIYTGKCLDYDSIWRQLVDTRMPRFSVPTKKTQAKLRPLFKKAINELHSLYGAARENIIDCDYIREQIKKLRDSYFVDE